jgi:hypothetical protein
MKRTLLAAIAMLLLAGCSSTITVKVPPRVTLDRAETVGVLNFTTQGEDRSGQDVTGSFLRAIHEEQPGVAFVELGDVETVLAEIGESRLSPGAIQAIGRSFGVDKILTGELNLEESEPDVDVNLSSGISVGSVSAKIRLDGTLDAKLLDAARGAVVWSASSSRWINLASLRGSTQGIGSASLPDRDRQYRTLVQDMVVEASRDFRSRWERQPKS